MSTPHLLTLKIRRPRLAPDDALQRRWGVAVCRSCGDTIVLGEDGRGSGAGLCAACRSLPATACLAAPVPIHGQAQPVLVSAAPAATTEDSLSAVA